MEGGVEGGELVGRQRMQRYAEELHRTRVLMSRKIDTEGSMLTIRRWEETGEKKKRKKRSVKGKKLHTASEESRDDLVQREREESGSMRRRLDIDGDCRGCVLSSREEKKCLSRRYYTG